MNNTPEKDGNGITNFINKAFKAATTKPTANIEKPVEAIVPKPLENHSELPIAHEMPLGSFQNPKRVAYKNEVIKTPFVQRRTNTTSNIIAPVTNDTHENSVGKLRIIPLGGLEEVGKNMTVIEYDNDMILIDCGLAFPDEELLGVDIVVPDITYVKKNANKLRAIIITHGHEDHIGALPRVMKELDAPIYCTKLAEGLITRKLTEYKMQNQVKIKCVNMGSRFTIASFGIEFIRTNHSIPDTSAIAISTPLGMVFHTGDFKIDSTPVYGPMMDLKRFGEIGDQGVLVLLSDSTNAEKSGFSGSERLAGEGLEEEFINSSENRIIVATFASSIFRIQQVLELAEKYGRKVAFSGRSMENMLEIASKLGFLMVPKDIIVDISVMNKLPKSKVVIITTGSQGEEMSALNRMSNGSHKQIQVGPGDKVLLSATPIPGNEKSVYKMIDELGKRGLSVSHGRKLHVSGHAYAEEQKIILSLIKPKYFMPVHGTFTHLNAHAKHGIATGVNPKNIFLGSLGRPLEITKSGARFGTHVTSGSVFVDGTSSKGVGTAVLRDRKTLSEDGLLIITIVIENGTGQILAGPDVSSRGFVFVKDSEELMSQIRAVTRKSLSRCVESNIRDWNTIKMGIKSDLSDFIYKKTRKNPMILTIITEV